MALEEGIKVYTKGDTLSCLACKRKLSESVAQACFLFDEDLEAVIECKNKSERRKAIRKFLVMVNALLNQGGGTIHVHTKPHLLGFWDEQIDEDLMHLVSDDTLFEENFERHVSEDDHVTFRVKPRDRPASTLEFYSKVSLNKGLVLPTHAQMRRLMRTDREREEEYCGPTLSLPKPLRQGQVVPICESIYVQAKVVLENKLSRIRGQSRAERLMTYWWEQLKLPVYITAFTKQKRGGSFYLGLREDKVQTGRKWILDPGNEALSVFFLGTKDRVFWKDDKNDDVLHFTTEEHVPKREHTKSGKFICEGIQLSTEDHHELQRLLQTLLQDRLLWQPVPPRLAHIDVLDTVKLHFHEVTADETNNNDVAVGHGRSMRRPSSQLRDQAKTSGMQSAESLSDYPTGIGGASSQQLWVVEARVSYFPGVCFQGPEEPSQAARPLPAGPEAYSFDSPNKPQHVIRVNWQNWLDNMQCESTVCDQGKLAKLAGQHAVCVHSM